MRYLIFGGPGIGDTIIEMSLAKGIKAQDKNAIIDLITSNNLGTTKLIDELINCQNYIDHHYSWTKKKKVEALFTLLKLIKNNYQYSFACSSSFKANDNPSKVSKLIGCKCIRKKFESSDNKTNDITVEVKETNNFVKQYDELFHALYPEASLDLRVLDNSKVAHLIDMNKGSALLITICLGTNITIYWKDGKSIEKNIKEWPIENWILIIKELVNKGYKVALIGGKKEGKAIEEYCNAIPKEVMNYCGLTTIKESLSIINQSNLVVGADTGMMHCAAALGIPTLSLFGGTDFRVWRPFAENNYVIIGKTECSPCYGNEQAITCQDRMCMRRILPHEVLLKIKEITKKL